jgi:hypothetical protein
VQARLELFVPADGTESPVSRQKSVSRIALGRINE